MKPLTAGVTGAASAAVLLGLAGPVGATATGPGAAGDELTFESLKGSGGTFTGPRGQLQDVEMDARDVTLAGSRVSMGRVTLEGVVPFSAVEEDIGQRTRLEPADDGRVRVIRTVEVLGRDVNVSGTGEVEAVDGQVVVEPATVDVGGPAWLEGLLGRSSRGLLAVEHDVPGLPRGLELRNVDVVEDGFSVRLSGEDVDFSG